MRVTRELTTGERMAKARNWVGLDQADMARILSYSRNTVSNWERGVSEPPFSVVKEWAKITGRTLDWFANGDETEKAPAEYAGASGVARPEGFEPPTF